MEGAEKITFLYVLQPKNFDSVIIHLKKKEVLIRWIRFPSSGLQRNSVQLCSHRSESLGAKLKLRSYRFFLENKVTLRGIFLFKQLSLSS